nr:hypothetical protein CFP56_77570 [Quercus suber]
MRSVLGGSRTRSVLDGLGIVEGGVERNVSPVMWERRIGDVGGEMGFADIRGDLGLASVCGVELCLSLIGALGGAKALIVGGLVALVGLWVELGLV